MRQQECAGSGRSVKARKNRCEQHETPLWTAKKEGCNETAP